MLECQCIASANMHSELLVSQPEFPSLITPRLVRTPIGVCCVIILVVNVTAKGL